MVPNVPMRPVLQRLKQVVGFYLTWPQKLCQLLDINNTNESAHARAGD